MDKFGSFRSNMIFFVLIVYSVLSISYCVPVMKDASSPFFLEDLAHCFNVNIEICLKEEAMKLAEKVTSIRELKVYDGIILYNSQRKAKNLEELSSNLDIRDKQINERLWKCARNMLQNSELEFTYTDYFNEAPLKSTEVEARSKYKKDKKVKKKVLIVFLILAIVKITLYVLALFTIIAVSLLKLAIIAKILFLWKVFMHAKDYKKHTKEEPMWSSHEQHGNWESPWAKMGSELAYSGYRGLVNRDNFENNAS